MSETLNRVPAAAAPHGKGSIPWLKLGVEMGPLILFFFANARPKLFEPLVAPFLPQALLSGANAGLFTATFVLMAAVGVSLVVSLVKTRKLPAMPLMTAVLALLFGALTLYLQDTTFIKMKPTVLYVGFGVALFGGLAMNKLLLPIIFDNAFSMTERGWRVLTLRWGGFFFLLALLNEIVWRTQSNDVWVSFKFPGIFILLFVFSIAQAPLILRHKLEVDAVEETPNPS
ncbi:septation protein A [Methylocapsa polymorpha]|uniref:Inner membrane-spanning protein YciB n=1 Tax=Methylocapsa polymorpha TaxID=3080828 RepID=A0ABZ0HWB0_9HYPH|nr:septation protein A [Methylocapsa sp. RX1]